MTRTNLLKFISRKNGSVRMFRLAEKIIYLNLILMLLLQVGCKNSFDKSIEEDHSVILSLIGFSLVTSQQGPCGKYVTINSTPQNLNFVSYVNSGINFSGAIVYMPNVNTANKILLCSNSNVNFYQTANFVMRLDNNCSPRITNTPKVTNVLGTSTLIGNCNSYPIQIDGSYTLSVFIEGNSYPNDAKVYLQ